jgi:hypothetical protein
VITETLVSGGRSLLVAAVACQVARGCAPLLVGQRRQLPLWLLVMVPFLTPSLLTGYGFGSFTLSLVRYPAVNELFYGLLLLLKLAPLAMLVVAFSPASPLSPAARHCARLCGDRLSRRHKIAFLIRGPARTWLAAFLVVLLLAFSERDLASLLGASQWTVRLFDAQVGGLALADSLRLGLVPAAVQTAMAIALLAPLLVAQGQARQQPTVLSTRLTAAARIYLLAAVVIVSLIPAVVALQGVVVAPQALLAQTRLVPEIGLGTLLVLVVVGTVWRLANSLRRQPVLLVLVCLPGLWGGLQVALAVQYLFQRPGLQVVYDTPMPQIVALVLVLTPFAGALSLLLAAFDPGSSLLAARLLLRSPDQRLHRNAEAVVRSEEGRGRPWAVLALFWIAYCEVTASALLAPVTLTPVFVRLYNLMHYGRSEVLSVMLVIAVGLPLAVLGMIRVMLVAVERRHRRVALS